MDLGVGVGLVSLVDVVVMELKAVMDEYCGVDGERTESKGNRRWASARF